LYIYPTTFADEADYVAVAYDGSSYVTSSIAHLYIYSTNLDVSLPTDTIVGFGDTTGNRYGGNTNAAYVIDDTFNEWMNGGSGFQAGSGFPPFGGPVGVIWTPSVGGSLIVGLRFYPGQDPAGYDPSGFVLEGSNNGGASWTTIASGALSLPLPRNDLALIVDPTQASAQEVLFSNTHVYTSYRLTFPSIRDPGNFGSLRIGDVEFLGVAATAPPPAPVISTTSISGGNLTINGSGGTPNSSFSVLTNADLSVPISQWGTATTGTYDGSGNFSISLPVDPAKPHLFYLISTP
jgi:hypothetical protein